MRCTSKNVNILRVKNTCMAIISLRGEVWTHKNSLTHHFLIEMPVPRWQR
jgi:hypothetical protein